MTRRLRYNAISAIQNIQTLEEVKDALRDIIYLVSEFSDTITADFTVNNNVAKWFLSCNNSSPITVTLPAEPEDGLEAFITRLNALVTIDGNGKNINGMSRLILNNVYDSPHLEFREADNEWRTV